MKVPISGSITQELVLVMDNATMHSSDDIIDLMHDIMNHFGIQIYLLPAYSPGLVTLFPN